MAVGGEKHERDSPLPPGELPLAKQLLAMFDGYAAGQIDSWYHQGLSKVVVMGGDYLTHPREIAMQKVINCPCGFVLKGESDEDVVQKAQAHAKQVHQMDLSREQALAMAKPA